MTAAAIEVVVMGGSSGSLEALRSILPHLPTGYPLAVIVVLHQHRHGGGQLAEALAAHAKLPVISVADKGRIEPGQICVAPANYHLLIEMDRTFALSTDPPVHFARPSIDVMFESAARVYRSRLLGILLSGGGADGSAGLATIKARGGFAACQDPETARDPSMPRAGCQATAVDWIASPEAIGLRLAQVCS